MHSRRRPRRGRYQPRNRAKLSFAPVIVMLCLSVGCGYAAAKYVVYPVVNYVPQMTANEDSKTKQAGSAEGTVIEDEADIKETSKVIGYALQFGCYSDKGTAEAVMPDVGIEGLKIIEQDDVHKIIGEIYETKEEARKELKTLPKDVDSFVTTIYEEEQ